jgi:predicted RNase H-like nuclease
MQLSKRTVAGRMERIEALRLGLPGLDTARLATPLGAKADDVLDALAAAWTAQRVVAGTHRAFGGECDATGLPMVVLA